jgi:hypothetical protein
MYTAPGHGSTVFYRECGEAEELGGHLRVEEAVDVDQVLHAPGRDQRANDEPVGIGERWNAGEVVVVVMLIADGQDGQ